MPRKKPTKKKKVKKRVAPEMKFEPREVKVKDPRGLMVKKKAKKKGKKA